MNIIKIALVTLLMSSMSVFADDCTWNLTGLNGGGSSGTLDVQYSCVIDGETAAVKQVTAKAVGSTTCQISLSTGFRNTGSCTSPAISEIVPNACGGTRPSGYIFGSTTNGSSIPGMMTSGVPTCSSCSGRVNGVMQGSTLVYQGICN